MGKIVNAKGLGRNNKASILFELQNEGAKSRLQLARTLDLTTASITKLVKELIGKGYVVETGFMQRNSTGRREVLVSINDERFAGIGVNIEKDKIHLSLCNYHNVIEERIYKTEELLASKNINSLIVKIQDIYKKHENSYEIMGLGVGIIGRVCEIKGISIDSYGILNNDYPLKAEIQKNMACDIKITNNVKAQARALISRKEDNFMYVKHSPGIGCAIVVDGKVVDGFNSMAGELGHTIVERNGTLCECGKHGCLETVASERAIEKQFSLETGKLMNIREIYSIYGESQIATQIIDNCLLTLALAIGNASRLNDPQKIILTGGVFSYADIYTNFVKKLEGFGFGEFCEIVNIDNEQRIKAYAGARHILLAKLFDL